MVMDDGFFDVTKHDIKQLIHQMKIHLFPKEQVIAVRKNMTSGWKTVGNG